MGAPVRLQRHGRAYSIRQGCASSHTGNNDQESTATTTITIIIYISTHVAAHIATHASTDTSTHTATHVLAGGED